jgi:hypothetical protein
LYAAISASNFVCSGSDFVETAAQQTASAYASAVASVVADCILVGDATAKVHAVANARAKAEVWVTSYFNAFSAAGDCETCEAFSRSYGYISKYVFLEAIATAEVKVCTASTSRESRLLYAHSHSCINECNSKILTL